MTSQSSCNGSAVLAQTRVAIKRSYLEISRWHSFIQRVTGHRPSNAHLSKKRQAAGTLSMLRGNDVSSAEVRTENATIALKPADIGANDHPSTADNCRTPPCILVCPEHSCSCVLHISSHTAPELHFCVAINAFKHMTRLSCTAATLQTAVPRTETPFSDTNDRHKAGCWRSWRTPDVK